MEILNFKTMPKMYGLIITGLGIYILYSILAGMPPTANLGAFITGLVVLFLATLALLLASWYLLFKPLPAGLKPSPVMPFSANTRQLIALLLVMTTSAGFVGGLWDAVWHASYGIPFGEDFFWRPHQFIYASLFTPIILAFFIAVQTMRKAAGTLQQRFRADLPMSLIMVGGVLMAFVLPSDPIWHLIYAEDLTGLSVPHTLFSVVNAFIQVGFLSIFVSYAPQRQNWESVLKSKLADFIILYVTASILMVIFLVSMGDWEAVNSPVVNVIPDLPELIALRPAWAMPALFGFISCWAGFIGCHASKRYGMATASAILAFIIRQGLFILFDSNFYGYETWAMLFPLMIAIDVLVYLGTKRQSAFATWQVALVLGILISIISVPIMNAVFPSIAVGYMDIPAIFITATLTSFAGTWMGRTIGDYIANPVRQTESETLGFSVQLLQRALAILLVIVTAATWFILTAASPLA